MNKKQTNELTLEKMKMTNLHRAIRKRCIEMLTKLPYFFLWARMINWDGCVTPVPHQKKKKKLEFQHESRFSETLTVNQMAENENERES